MGLYFQNTNNLSKENLSEYFRYYFTVLPISICVLRLLTLLLYFNKETAHSYVKSF